VTERALFTAAALLGLVLRNEDRHGRPARGTAQLAAEAADLGKATAEAYGPSAPQDPGRGKSR
jgi:hypothetical protein